MKHKAYVIWRGEYPGVVDIFYAKFDPELWNRDMAIQGDYWQDIRRTYGEVMGLEDWQQFLISAPSEVINDLAHIGITVP